MKLLYLNEHLSCLNYQVDSDLGFTCQQLEENEEYRIDNSKSPCTLFMIEGEVFFDLGKYKGLRILQNQMVFIPQNIGTRIYFFHAEDGIRVRSPSRGLGDVYKIQPLIPPRENLYW